MPRRLRIFLLLLALAVLASINVIGYADGPDGSTPKLAFSLCGYTNIAGRYATLRITNHEKCAVELDIWCAEIEGSDGIYPVSAPRPVKLLRGCSGSVVVKLPTRYGEDGGHARWRWRLRCHEERLTWISQVRRRMARWPAVGRLVETPPTYFATQLFSQ